VLHELDAGAVGEQIPQQALQQRRDSAQPLADERDGQLDAKQDGEAGPRHGAAGLGQVDRQHHLVHDELADPEHRQRDDRPGDPEHQDPDHIARVGLPHHPEQLGQVLERLEPLAPAAVRRRRHAAAPVAADDGVLEREGHPGKVSASGKR
jgi:hypothetical protein